MFPGGKGQDLPLMLLERMYLSHGHQRPVNIDKRYYCDIT